MLRASQSASPGSLAVVEITADTGTGDLYLGYGYNETGVYSPYVSTLSVNADYTKHIGDGNFVASSPQSIKLNTAGQTVLLQFYVVQSNVSPYRKSLAFMAGNIVKR